ncbi:hypothetical protein DPMN_172174 [Dreissena polymorpha]|uniref:Uncharacterized protein n=1 Tax=Dreissena polymorpha TaxID=45954 RepID=A0A9D4DZC2_DREPO|nr:hypothetical protein DPMN_172174 [Dreissena polymorpha]
MQAKLKKKPAVMYGHSDTVRQLLEGQVRTRPAPYPLPQRPTPPSIVFFRGYSGHASRVGSSVISGGRAPSPEVSKRALRPGSSDATEASPPAIESAVFKDEFTFMNKWTDLPMIILFTRKFRKTLLLKID